MNEDKELSQEDNNNGDIGRESGIERSSRQTIANPNPTGIAENEELHGIGEDKRKITGDVVVEKTKLTHHGSHAENNRGTTEDDL